MKFFDPNSPVSAFISRIGDLIILNLLCIVCSLPFVTLGCSISAMYYVTLRMRRKQDVFIFRDFFHAFRLNLKQGIIFHLLFSLICIILSFDMYVLWKVLETELFLKIVFGALILLSIGFLAVCLYTYPLLAQFDNSIRGLLKNARYMSLKHFSYTMAMLLVNAAPWVIGMYMPYVLEWVLILYFFIGFSLMAHFNSRYFVKIFDQYIPKDPS